jgi:septal ring factor EnvC (AmiA/AmiB activator)
MVVAVVAALLVSTGTAVVSGSVPTARADSGYPTWGQVQAAKASEAATQAEVTKINGLLTQLQNTANAAANLALQRSAEYAQDEQQLTLATNRASALKTQALAAQTKAASLRKQSGMLTEQLAQAGASGLTASILMSGKKASDLLYRLGTVSNLSEQAASLFKAATQQSNLAASVSAQAAAAEKERQSLAATAKTALAAAQQAQESADAQVAAEQTTEQTMVAQLASLQNTTAQLVQQYNIGQQVAAQEAAAAAAAAEGGAEGFAPPVGVDVDPAAAQAYAASQIGAYGWDSGQMQCLIWLWTRESGWRLDAYNTSSGAYGIPQSLPADKMAAAGPDWQTNADTQINWGLAYIKSAYGSPCAAWAHETAHSWY